MSIKQLDLFNAVQSSYVESKGILSQKELYAAVAKRTGINPEEHYEACGKQDKVNLFYRSVRWCQQALKEKKLLTRVSRGIWQLTDSGKEKMEIIEDSKSVLAMSTSLGIMICSKCQNVFESDVIQEDVHLVIMSPPYLLQKARNYGGPTEEKEWVEFIMSTIRPLFPRLAKGASIALNVGQDVFHKGLPARRTHLERLVLTMQDEGMWLVDRLIWTSNKAPGPAPWTSMNRFMLRNSYEYVYHFTNSPLDLRSNNQRVLVEHTEAHKKFVMSGGTRNPAYNSDGAHIKTAGDYANTDLSKGKILTNTLYHSNSCSKNRMVNRYARSLGLPVHGAKMPYSLAKMLVEYLSEPDDLVVIPCGGTGTLAASCEETGRKWISMEPVLSYIKQSFVRFTTLTDDIWINPAFKNAHYDAV